MPEFIASGSHNFNDRKYRFLILPRYKCDLHSIIKDRRIDTKNLLIIACQILDILEHIHDKGYAHSDIKAENLMIGTCTYRKKHQSQSSLSTDSGRDSNDDYDGDEDDDASENDDEHAASMDDSDFELDSGYKTPVTTNRREKKVEIEFSGSNPVRSCRMERKYSMYQDMLSSHYLRPSRKVNYYEDDDDDYMKNHRKSDEDVDWFRGRKIEFNLSTEQRHELIEDDDDDGDGGETVTEDRIYLIDYGLSLKFINSAGIHHPFVMDQRRAHDGTIEFTSRDAHMGAHSRRSDLECLGYNLIYWCEGTLPWKDEKLMTQPEQVHRMKEYFMADVKEVYKSIYGQSAPKFIAEFLDYVGKLAYHDRPDYGHCRNIFVDEMKKLCNGHLPDMRIDLADLKKKPLRNAKNGMENNNVKLKDVKEMMKLHQKEPFRENGLLNRISPKNLRSKSEKIPKKQQMAFSWTDVLSTDPDQIARQRAEKEIERDMTDTPITSRYEGKPTYAILAVQNRIKFKEKLETKDDADRTLDDFRIDGYTPAMMDVVRKRQSMLAVSTTTTTAPISAQCDTVKSEKKLSTSNYHQYSCSQPLAPSTNGTMQPNRLNQRKSGLRLRNNVRQTQKFVSFCKQTVGKKRRNGNSEFTPTDESSCGSAASIDDSSNVVAAAAAVSSVVAAAAAAVGRVIPPRNRRRYHSNTDLMSPSDDDSRDTTDYTPIQRKPTRKTPQKNKVLKKCLPSGKGE